MHSESQDQTKDIGDRETRLDPRKYSVFRLDGHSFSKFVKSFGMNLPFDADFTAAMKHTAIECFTYLPFELGFVGSDEITFTLRPLSQEQLNKKGTLEFSGRVQKLVSLLAGKVSTTFFIELTNRCGFEKTKHFRPHFDCRVFQVSTFRDTLEQISDRVVYTLKNARMMLAQKYYSAKELHKIPSKEAVAKLLSQKQIDFDKLVSGDNRVGTVLRLGCVQVTKNIVVKGETKTISFNRKIVLEGNYGPKEVMELPEKEPIDLEPFQNQQFEQEQAVIDQSDIKGESEVIQHPNQNTPNLKQTQM